MLRRKQRCVAQDPAARDGEVEILHVLRGTVADAHGAPIAPLRRDTLERHIELEKRGTRPAALGLLLATVRHRCLPQDDGEASSEMQPAGECRTMADGFAGSPPVLQSGQGGSTMSQQTVVKPRTKTKTKTQRPPLWKVILLNDDYTPREFVVMVLKAVFRMGEEKAYAVMLTAHRRGACVIAVYARDIAETKATEAMELAKSKGYPLAFSTEPEE